MPETRKTRRVGGAGLGILSFRSGIDGPKNPTKNVVAQAEFHARLRRRRLIEHLHRLGPAPLGYFLREVENGASIPGHLERYSRIDPDFIAALGGGRFAPALHVIDGGDHDPRN